MELLELYIKNVQRNELTAKNSPLLFIILTIICIIFLYTTSTYLDNIYESDNYFFIIALIPTITHFIAWIFAYKFQTGHFFDLNGEISLLITLLFSIIFTENKINEMSTRKILISLCTILWDVRLGAFCFIRMMMRGKDFRFEEIKPAASFYLFSHIAQSVWIWLICSCLWIYNLEDSYLTIDKPLTNIDYLGLFIFIFGFLIEIIADEQKWKFKNKYDTKKEWIQSGLWSLCRHPNYFGEMVLWLGICIMCISQNNINGLSLYLSWISPIWSVFFLVTTSLSMLERLADKRYGQIKTYWRYKKNTPILVPFLC